MHKVINSTALFQQRLEQIATDTEAVLQRLLAPQPEPGERMRPPRLLDAMRYATLGGGKRFRPFLVVETRAAVRRGADRALMVARRARMHPLLFAGA